MVLTNLFHDVHFIGSVDPPMTHVHSCRVEVYRVAQILHHGSPEHTKTVILLLKLRLRLQQLTHSRTLLILHFADLHSQSLVLRPHFVQFASEFVAILIMPRLLLEVGLLGGLHLVLTLSELLAQGEALGASLVLFFELRLKFLAQLLVLVNGFE